MKKSVIPLALAVLVTWGLFLPQSAVAQEEGPGTRVIAVTTFDVPYGPDRGLILEFMRDRWLPQIQLNPKVLGLRVAQHLYGSNADQIVVISEYAEWADIQAPCGAPCTEYYEAHPVPEEGTPEREEFDKAVAAWNKVYTSHRDEIFSAPMFVAKTEGELVGTVGPPGGGD